MQISNQQHLTYCTNIHPGENWQAVFNSLERYVLPIKNKISPNQSFGIGLRLSNKASQELGGGEPLEAFRRWLDEHGCYVFTMNGFPYGEFHGNSVKEDVHHPDWTTRERVYYTIRLANQLSALLPEGMDGGISTSPLSYKLWHEDIADRETAIVRSTEHILEVVDHLFDIEERTGQHIHLDLEPEPDGLLEDSRETIDYWQRWLLPMGIEHFAGRLHVQEAESVIRRHVNLCYDACHFAVEYETPEEAIRAFREQGIQIGKVQISSALKSTLPEKKEERKKFKKQFEVFNESTYLHQVIARDVNNRLINYPDLPDALAEIDDPDLEEWRMHFHVPLFVDHYHDLKSTQDEVIQLLDIQRREPFTNHLEVETYTWEVLPKGLQKDLKESIERELEWVKERMLGDGK